MLLPKPNPPVGLLPAGLRQQILLGEYSINPVKQPFWEHYTDPIPEALLNALKHDRLVAFVGAGVSRRCLSKTRAPLPDWPALLLYLIEWGHACHLLDGATVEDLKQLLSRNEYLMVAQECRELVGDEQLTEFMNQVFDPDGVVPARVHELLSAVPFRGYITTNYDNLLERAHTHVQNRQLRSVLPEGVGSFFSTAQRARPLLKLHGDLDDPPSIILGHRDYLRLIWTPTHASFVRSLLADFTLLFVGYSLSDLDVLLPLDQLVHEGAVFMHFLLSQRGARNAVEKKRLLRDRRVQVIEYVNYFGFHNHVDTFLEGLLIASGSREAMTRTRMPLRARIQVHYAQDDENDGLFVWHYIFREGAITLTEETQHAQWEQLQKSLSAGFPALDHLVFLVSRRSLENAELMGAIVAALPAATVAGVMVVFLAVGFEGRPEVLAQVAATSPVFLLKQAFSESGLEPLRKFLVEDIKGGYRQP